MDLDTQGRILVQISIEEKEDIQFYFGRAFRSLKRAEADIGQIFSGFASTGALCFNTDE